MIDKIKDIIEMQNQRTVIDELNNDNEPVENAYKAFEVSRGGKPEMMISICYKTTKTQLLYYFDIRDILIESHTLITIIRPHEVISIKGRNLNSMTPYFKNNHIHTITEFNSKIYNKIPSDDKAFIGEITIESIK